MIDIRHVESALLIVHSRHSNHERRAKSESHRLRRRSEVVAYVSDLDIENLLFADLFEVRSRAERRC